MLAVAAKVRRALSVAIGNGALASRFLGGNGFSVLEVRRDCSQVVDSGARR
jgi:hypothetical protein